MNRSSLYLSMATSRLGLSNNNALGSPVRPGETNRVHNLLDAQLFGGALSALGDGVIENDEGTSLEVTAEDGLFYVSAGAAIIAGADDTTPYSVWGELAAPEALSGLDGFVHVALVEGDAGDPNTAEGTAQLLVLQSPDEELPGALLLAEIVGGAVIDRREFSRPDRALRKILTILSDISYDEVARQKGDVNRRLNALEAPIEGDPNSEISIGAFNALGARVAALERALAALDAKVTAQNNSGTQQVPQPTELLADHVSLLWAGLAEVNPPAIERAPIAVVVATAGHGQSDTPDFTPDTDPTDPKELPWNPETATFGP